MAKIRSIHPTACDSRKLAAISSDAERLFWRLQCHCDDAGRIEDEPAIIGAKCVPLIGWSADRIDVLLAELASVEGTPGTETGLLVRYATEGRHWIEIRLFRKHQRPRWPKESTIPGMSDGCPTYVRRQSDGSPTPVGHMSPQEGVGVGVGVGVGDAVAGGDIQQRAIDLVMTRRGTVEQSLSKDIPHLWLAHAIDGIRDELLAVGEHDDPERWAALVSSDPPPPPPDPAAAAQAAQRRNTERGAKRARGKHDCHRCFDVGMIETDTAGVMAPCPDCAP